MCESDQVRTNRGIVGGPLRSGRPYVAEHRDVRERPGPIAAKATQILTGDTIVAPARHIRNHQEKVCASSAVRLPVELRLTS
jgi:hypothetical protein